MPSNPNKPIVFPTDFLWGVSVSHFQVEGFHEEFESRLSDWSNWTTEEGRILDGTNADKACDFYSLFEQDIDLISELNLNTFRTSLNWAALLPEPGNSGAFNSKACEYYRRLFSKLKERGITVFVSLFHFCLPEWLAKEGGWTEFKTVDAFQQYTKLAVEAFGDLVDFWVTFNEPLVYAYQGYVAGIWPPGSKSDFVSAFKVVKHLLTAHALAYQEIQSSSSPSPVGFSNHWTPFIPEKPWSIFDRFVCSNRDKVFNHIFPKSVETGSLSMPGLLAKQKDLAQLEGEIEGLKGAIDFLGVNYYSRELSRFDFSSPLNIFGSKSKNPEFPINDLGWEIYPQGLFRVLTEDIKPYSTNPDGTKRPVFITENGFCRKFQSDMGEGDWSLSDSDRCQFLISHLVSVNKAIVSGANVKGYIHWSLLDNFEWAEGLCARFGLCRVDYSTQHRTKRDSAKLYSSIAKANFLETF